MVKEISNFRPQANQDCFTSSQIMKRLTNMLQRETLICFQIFLSIFLPFTFSQKQGLRLGTAREAFSFGVKLYGSKVVQDPFRTFCVIWRARLANLRHLFCHLQPEKAVVILFSSRLQFLFKWH